MAPGPTLLQIIPKLDAGGAELAVIDVAEATVRAGGRALVLAEPGRLVERVRSVGGEVLDFPAATKNPLQMWRNARAIAALVRANDIRLVHARSRAPAWSALAACRTCGIPFVTTYHGAYNETNAIKRLYNSVMARGDITIANSQFTARLIRERYHTDPRKLVVIHRGVDTAQFDPELVTPARVKALRKAWGAREETRVVFQAARLTGWKGQRIVIDAAAKLKQRGDLRDVLFVLAGDPQGRADYVAELQSLIEISDVRDAVRIVGHVVDMPAAYLAAHVTVIASTEPEAFGRTVIEAGAMRCPTVVTNLGAPPEIVTAAPPERATGWIVPPADPAALAAAIAEALGSDREGVGARARAHVLAHFTKAELQRHTLRVYDQLLKTDLERRFIAQ